MSTEVWQLRLMVVLLRLGGGVMLLAFLTVPWPTSWMAGAHRWLGLGEFPESTLVQYLTRSIALLYGIHGGLLLLVARDVSRFAPLVVYLATMDVVFGVAVTVIDVRYGMPWFWTLGEGPPIAAMGLLLLGLARSQRAKGAIA